MLSGDNALVVALACRGLEPRQRLWGMVLGTAAAVLLRIIFTVVVATVMGMPYLKLAGGLALIVIAAKLLVPDGGEHDSVQSASHLWAAVQIVVVADIVMSLDNVIAVAAAAEGSIPLLILGLASSIPLVIAGAALIIALLDLLPILVWAGCGAAGLDRRRRHRDRSGGSTEAAKSLRWCGWRRARRPARASGRGPAVCPWKRRRDCLCCAGCYRRAGGRIDLAKTEPPPQRRGCLVTGPLPSALGARPATSAAR